MILGSSARFDELEGVVLRTPLAEVLAMVEGAGWRHNARPIDTHPQQRVRVRPDAGAVTTLDLQCEDALVIGVIALYREPDALRRIRFEALPRQREASDAWYFADADRQVMAMVARDGSRVQLLHTGSARDRREVEAMYRSFLP